jgi:hypothetical protein
MTKLLLFITCALTLSGCAAPDATMREKLDAQSKVLSELQDGVRNAQASAATPGRYQIINGTPQFARNIMLVDTHTGRSWLLCETKDKESATSTNWCAMEFYGSPGTP